VNKKAKHSVFLQASPEISLLHVMPKFTSLVENMVGFYWIYE